jgi:hypothetical protein
MTVRAEPYQRVRGGARSFDWYMLPFDRGGHCTAPVTREAILSQAESADITDVFIFSHGWNNDWNVATKRYSDFISGYTSLRQLNGIAMDRPFNPLLVGLFWPSTALVFGSERGISIASADVDDSAAVAAQERAAEIAALAAEVDDGEIERFYELVDRAELTDAEGAELARILAPVLDSKDEEDPALPTAAAGAIDVLAGWYALSADAASDDATVAEVAEELENWGVERSEDDLAGASAFGKLDPRQIVRATTVRLMKDRAGAVGARGGGPFLTDLLERTAQTKPRVHLIGHSYGAKVCLSALCYPIDVQRPIDSLLLLQPAISHRCFADDDAGRGGYVNAPSRVRRPILSTFSENDTPLRRLFQLAVWRGSDKDELKIAAAGQPGRFSALGGYGPRGLGERSQLIKVRLPDADGAGRYDLGETAPDVYGIDATATIGGHGDVNNDSTWWMLDNLVAAP